MRQRSIDERIPQWIGEMQSPSSSSALLCAQISQWHLRRFHPLRLRYNVRTRSLSLISLKIFAPRLNRICLRVSGGGGRNLPHPALQTSTQTTFSSQSGPLFTCELPLNSTLTRSCCTLFILTETLTQSPLILCESLNIYNVKWTPRQSVRHVCANR